jgi:hypothetical protein
MRRKGGPCAPALSHFPFRNFTRTSGQSQRAGESAVFRPLQQGCRTIKPRRMRVLHLKKEASMFDFNRLMEGVTGLLQSTDLAQQAAQHLGAGQVVDLLQNQGFDLVSFQNLTPDQIVEPSRKAALTFP